MHSHACMAFRKSEDSRQRTTAKRQTKRKTDRKDAMIGFGTGLLTKLFEIVVRLFEISCLYI